MVKRMKYRLLIADDEAVEREALEYVAAALFPETFEIRLAENGRRAIELANDFAPDIAMMDIKMPLVNGIDAARQIMERYPDCKIIMLTGFTYFNYAKECVSLGAVDFLVKPASDEMVESALKSAIKAADKTRAQVKASIAADDAPELREREKRLCRLLEQRDFDEAQTLFGAMLDDILAQSRAYSQVVIYELLVVINRRAGEWVEVSQTYPFLDKLEAMADDDERRKFAEEYFEKVIGKLIAADENNSPKWADELANVMQTEYARGLTLESAAGRMGFSTFYFSRLFKQKFEKSFVEYLTEIRIQKAKELLSLQNTSVKDVCYKVGYSEPNYFARVFKRETGISPSEFRRRKLGKRGAR